jgi:hypothetical protein
MPDLLEPPRLTIRPIGHVDPAEFRSSVETALRGLPVEVEIESVRRITINFTSQEAGDPVAILRAVRRAMESAGLEVRIVGDGVLIGTLDTTADEHSGRQPESHRHEADESPLVPDGAASGKARRELRRAVRPPHTDLAPFVVAGAVLGGAACLLTGLAPAWVGAAAGYVLSAAALGFLSAAAKGGATPEAA